MTGAEKRQLKKLTKDRVPQSKIAKTMHIGKTTVRRWQRKLGLTPKGDRTGFTRLPEEEEKLRRSVWKKGYNDTQAGKLVGISREAYRDWRKRRQIPHNEGLPVINEYDMRFYEPDTEEFLNTIMEG